ncbi:hypothetical protein [Microbacterium sp. G2-8]|uniref:hypothetical protein n=1 Tax=Microbacterium sp. G2-8 TaxID=2842454 RepID=UPI001C89C948|nr:hypothetical protein [Microbacterium sp. G2-8]
MANYLARIGLGAEMERMGVSHDLPSVNARDLSAQLLELQKVQGEHGGEKVAALVADKLHANGTDPAVVEALHNAICETVGNIEFHAEVDGGYAVAQTINGRIIFAIADSGIGLRESLEKRQAVNDDSNAIELATVANISATGEVGRGQGLPETVSTSIAAGGVVHIASGVAIFRYEGDTVTKRTVDQPFEGTVIQVSLPA